MLDEGRLGEFDFIEDRIQIVKLLELLSQTKEQLWLWQEEEGDQRLIHLGVIKRVVEEKNIVMLFSGRTGVHFNFNPTGPIFVYSQNQRMAFQAKRSDSGNEFVNLEMPFKVGVLSAEQCQKLSVIEKENESAHQHKRTHERKHPQAGKVVRVEKVVGEDEVEESGDYELYDISQGGLSFHVEDPSLFQVGDQLQFLEMDGEVLGKRLQGTVMSVRQVAEDETITLKVGVRFDDKR